MRAVQTATTALDALEIRRRSKELIAAVFQVVATTYMIEQLYLFLKQP